MDKTHRLWRIGLVIVMFLASSLAAGTAGKKARYVGGTLSDVQDGTEGRFNAADPEKAEFLTKKGVVLFEIPYKNITGLEYGQKAGRRVGLAIAVSPLFLFSKKRKHFMTVYFKDADDADQAAVFEFGKGDVHEFGTTMETRSGQEIDFESEEARKHFEKGARK